MKTTLTPELERLIEERLKSGRYNSASEVIREALRLTEREPPLGKLTIQKRPGRTRLHLGPLEPCATAEQKPLS